MAEPPAYDIDIDAGFQKVDRGAMATMSLKT